MNEKILLTSITSLYLPGEDFGQQHRANLMQQECISEDFEMNGRTIDTSNFEPRVSSTPFPSRACDVQVMQEPEKFAVNSIGKPIYSLHHDQSLCFDLVEQSPNIPVHDNVKKPKFTKPKKKSLADVSRSRNSLIQ